MSNKRIETKSSQTADYTCFSRGCATREKDPRFRGPDYLAEILFPPMAKVILNVTPLRKLVIHSLFIPGIHEYIYARTKVMDSAFTEALEAGFAQIVLLGAGFDTRPIRFANRNRGTKIFELDAPTTQQAKIGVLQRKKISLPPELIFAPIDFDKDDLLEALSKAGFQPGLGCLFLWEGVTMYLTAQAVDKTLDFIRRCSAPGSRLAFDYIYASVLRRENRYYGEQKGFDRVAKVGEGWTFGLEEGEIGPFLAKRGFQLLAHFTSQDLEKLYLTNLDGSLHGRVNGTHAIALAEVNALRPAP
jgi:methyltransferase (TIGR00027 family)